MSTYQVYELACDAPECATTISFGYFSSGDTRDEAAEIHDWTRSQDVAGHDLCPAHSPNQGQRS